MRGIQKWFPQFGLGRHLDEVLREQLKAESFQRKAFDIQMRLLAEMKEEGEQFSRDLLDDALSVGADPLPFNRLTKGKK